VGSIRSQNATYFRILDFLLVSFLSEPFAFQTEFSAAGFNGLEACTGIGAVDTAAISL
jgi:hypothetical protein